MCFTSHSFLYTQKYLLLLAQTGLVPSPPFSLFLQSFSISLCFFSPSNFVSPVCTTQATFLLANSIRLFHALPFLQCSPQGAIVSQQGGSITPALLLSATTPPSSSCFPSNHVLHIQLVQYQHSPHLQVIISFQPIGTRNFSFTTGGIKLLSNNEEKKTLQ